MACDQSAHDRMCWVTEKELKMGNKTMGSIGHMENLQCGARLIVQWVYGIVDGDHTSLTEGCIGVVCGGGSAVEGK